MSKRFKVEHKDYVDNPTMYITLHNPPYEDEDVLARIKWKAKDVIITEMKTMEYEESTDDSSEG